MLSFFSFAAMFLECCCSNKAETTITAVVAGEEDGDASEPGDGVKEAQPLVVDQPTVVEDEPKPEETAPEEPVVKEPVAVEPVPAEPVPAEPVTAEPVTAEPVSGVVALSLGLPGGSKKTVMVSKRPMGLEYKVPPAAPAFKVVAVEGQAAELGVEVGWTVLAVGDVAMARAEDVAAAAKVLATLPVQMWLEQPGSGEKTVLISRQPLGMEFKRKAPFDVTVVTGGSLAEELGISVGMLVKRVGGTLLRSEGDANKAIAEIAGLPTA